MRKGIFPISAALVLRRDLLTFEDGFLMIIGNAFIGAAT